LNHYFAAPATYWFQKRPAIYCFQFFGKDITRAWSGFSRIPKQPS
jgi:hypothetical protein